MKLIHLMACLTILCGAAPARAAYTLYPNIAYGPDPKQVMDVYAPKGGPAVPAVVLVHGGGFTSGDKSQWATYAADAAGHGLVAAAINYRLAPQPWHYQLDDVEAAVTFLRANAARMKVVPGRIAVGGDSAGGTLALDAADRRGPTFAQATFGWSGGYDLRTMYQSDLLRGGVLAFVGGCAPDACPDRYDYGSAVTNVGPLDPPARLANSDAELMPLQQLQEEDAALRAAGVYDETVVYPGARHGLDYGADEWPATRSFLLRELGGASARRG